eukprot:6190967-Pleurochrysis_carterae.AAC.1
MRHSAEARMRSRRQARTLLARAHRPRPCEPLRGLVVREQAAAQQDEVAVSTEVAACRVRPFRNKRTQEDEMNWARTRNWEGRNLGGNEGSGEGRRAANPEQIIRGESRRARQEA